MQFAHRFPSVLAVSVCLSVVSPFVYGDPVPPRTTAGLTAKTMPVHPFMLFEAGDISALAKRRTHEPLLDRCWTRMATLANSKDVFDDESPKGKRWDRTELWDQLIARAFVGKIENDPGMMQRAITLMQRAIKQSDPYDFYGADDGDFHFHAGPLVSLALAWDWLYPDMTVQQRAAILPGLETWADACYTYNNKQWWREASYNVGAISIGGLGIISLAIRPDSTHPHASLWLREATRRMAQNFYPTSWKPSGICYEGPNYAIVGLKYPAMFSESLRRAGGEDLFGDSGAVHSLNYLMHQWLPQGGCASIGDNTTYGRRTFAAEYLMSAARTDDQAGLWTWYNNLDERYIDPLVTYLWYPLNVQRKSPADSKTPTSKYFEVTANRAGYLFSRSAWDDPKAAFFSFVTRFERCNHEHYDMNSFLFGGHGTIFATHEMIYPYDSKDHGVDFEHNMVIVDGGGWPEHDVASCGDDNSTEGVLTGLATGPFADYARGDAKWSYRDNTIITSNPAIRAERTVLFVKAGEHPYMVAFDDIQFSDDAHDYRWQWHAPSDVTIEGPGTVDEPLMLCGPGGSCALSFVVPTKPAVTTQPVASQDRRHKNKPLQRIDVNQKEIRARYVAIATLQQKLADKPTISVQPVECDSDSAGSAAIQFTEGSTDHLAWQSEEIYQNRGSDLTTGKLQTDGLLAMVRIKDGKIIGYVLGEGTYLKWDDQALVQAKGSVCVSTDSDGVKLFGWRQARKGLPTIEVPGVKAYTPKG